MAKDNQKFDMPGGQRKTKLNVRAVFKSAALDRSTIYLKY